MPELNYETVLTIYQSDEQFPINIDLAVEWIGYSSKQVAKDRIVYNFVEGQEFSRSSLKNPRGGRPKEEILLTIDCFKQLAMMAQTARGKQVRQYFLDCEKLLKDCIIEWEIESEEIVPSADIEALKLENTNLKLALDQAHFTFDNLRLEYDMIQAKLKLSQNIRDILALNPSGSDLVVRFLNGDEPVPVLEPVSEVSMCFHAHRGRGRR